MLELQPKTASNHGRGAAGIAEPQGYGICSSCGVGLGPATAAKGHTTGAAAAREAFASVVSCICCAITCCTIGADKSSRRFRLGRTTAGYSVQIGVATL